MACQRPWPSPNFADPEKSKRGGARKARSETSRESPDAFKQGAQIQTAARLKHEADLVVAKLRWQ